MSRSAELLGAIPFPLERIGSVARRFDDEGVETVTLTPSRDGAVVVEIRLTPLVFEVRTDGLVHSGRLDDGWAETAAETVSLLIRYGVRSYRRPAWLERIVVGPGDAGRWFQSSRSRTQVFPAWADLSRTTADRTVRRTYLFRGMEHLFAG